MERLGGSEVVVHPLRQLPRGSEVVANLRDDQVRDLDVNLLRVSRVENRLEDRVRARDVDVLPNEIRFSGSFEIDSDTVEELRHFGNGLRGVVTIGHEDIDESGFPSEHPDVPSELDEDRRLIVRVGKTLTPLLESHA